MPALLTRPFNSSTRSAASRICSASVTSRSSSSVPSGASPSRRTPANTRHPARASLTAHACPIPDDAPVTMAVRVNPAARRRSGRGARVRGLRLRGGGRDRCLLVVLGDAPCSPVGERAGKLGLDEGVGELVGDGLVHADLPSELLPVLRVLDREVECLLPDADRLERERRQALVLRPVLVEERLPHAGAPALLEEDGFVDEAQLGRADLVARPAPVREGVARLAAEELLLFGEGELHQRLLGRPSTRSAMMFRRISEVPASIVLPRLRSCWWPQ